MNLNEKYGRKQQIGTGAFEIHETHPNRATAKPGRKASKVRTNKHKREDTAIPPGPKVKVPLELQEGLISDLFDLKDNLDNAIGIANHVKSIIDKIEGFVKFERSDDFYQAFISRLENLLILIFDLIRRPSLPDMIAPIVLYIKTHLKSQSIIGPLIARITKLLSVEESEWEDLEVQSGWFSDHWQQFSEGTLGQSLGSVLNLLIMSGFIPERFDDQLNGEIGKILHLHADRKKHPSLFHHLFATLDWLSDCVIPALMTKNYSLLLSTSDMVEIDERYIKAMHLVQLNVAGQMEEAEEKYKISDEAAVMVYLEETRGAYVALIKRSKSIEDKNSKAMLAQYTNRVIQLDKVIVDLQSLWKASGTRVCPYAVLIRGGSSVGKTTISTILGHVICSANSFPQGKEYEVTLNAQDEYQ